jgi:restriction system protein
MIGFWHLMVTILRGFWWAVPILLLAVLVKMPLFRGVFGRWWIDLAVRLQLDSDVYHMLRNVTLPTGEGTIRIDQVIVSRYGVFVVETRNMQGRIFGGRDQKFWIRRIYKCNQRFQNPLHQNHMHAKFLETELGLDAYKVFSVVVFVGGSRFSTPVPENVTQGAGFVRYILSKRKVVLTEDDVTYIIRRLASGLRSDLPQEYLPRLQPQGSRRAA